MILFFLIRFRCLTNNDGSARALHTIIMLGAHYYYAIRNIIIHKQKVTPSYWVEGVLTESRFVKIYINCVTLCIAHIRRSFNITTSSSAFVSCLPLSAATTLTKLHCSSDRFGFYSIVRIMYGRRTYLCDGQTYILYSAACKHIIMYEII